MFLTRAEFRRIRDEEALKTYRQLWPKFRQQELDLRRELNEMKQQKHWGYAESNKALEEAMRPLHEDLQYVTAKLTAMTQDALVRKERLGQSAWSALSQTTKSEEKNAEQQ